MISKFIDREEEISLLEDEWKKEKGGLIVLYGRRRIGKTRLLMEFANTRRGIFYIAEQSSAQVQINGMKEKIADFLNDPLLKTLEIRDWEQLFGYLANNMPEERFYLIIDEFSYLIRSDVRVLSVLQKLWDTKFASSSSAFIVLSGSLLGLMSEKVLSYASPLYKDARYFAGCTAVQERKGICQNARYGSASALFDSRWCARISAKSR